MNDIIKLITSLGTKYSVVNIYQDFVALMALELSVKIGCTTRVEKLNGLIKKYTEEELKLYEEFKGLVVKELKENPFQDLLGTILHTLEVNNKYSAQFFTPYYLSYATVKITALNFLDKKDDVIHIAEPSCGSGGMCIAICQIAQESNINYAHRILFNMNDIDTHCCYMSFIQLNLIGASAVINHKNTLNNDYFDSFLTLGAIINKSLERLKMQNKIKTINKFINEINKSDNYNNFNNSLFPQNDFISTNGVEVQEPAPSVLEEDKQYILNF